VSCYLANPNWKLALINTAKPTFRFDAPYLYMLIGLVGTTIAPWMQFYLQSAVVEKGIGPKDYFHSRLDVVIGCIMTDAVALFIFLACAVTIFATGPK